MNNDNLDKLFKTFDEWKSGFRQKTDDLHDLQKTLLNSNNENSVLKKQNKCLQDEISKLNEIIIELRRSLSRLTKLEIVNGNLSKQNEKLKNELEQVSETCRNNELEARTKIKKLLEKQKEEIEQIRIEIEKEKSIEMSVILEKLKEKDQRVCELEAEKQSLECKKEEELMILKIEYEEKMAKLKSQPSMNKPLPLPVLPSTDIFRKKYQELELRHKDEIEGLKNEILSLKSRNEMLLSQNSSLNMFCFDVGFSKMHPPAKDSVKPASPLDKNVQPASSLEKNVQPASSLEKNVQPNQVAADPPQVKTTDHSKKPRVPIKRKKLFHHQTDAMFEG